MGTRRQKPRAVTLTLPDSKQPYLHIGKKEYTLRNISEDGIGVWVNRDESFGGSAVGSPFQAEISVEGNRYPVDLVLVHRGDKRAGLQIVAKDEKLSAIFRKLLEPSRQAMILSPHEHSGTEDSQVGFPRLWYSSTQGAELLVWYQAPDYVIKALQICWLGKFVYRSQFQKSRTGILQGERRLHPGTSLHKKEILLEEPEADLKILKEASQFLTSTPPPLPGFRLWQFLELGEIVNLPEDLLSQLRVA